MDKKINVTIRDIDHSDALQTFINKKSDKLFSHCSKIKHCSLVIEQTQKHQHQGKLYKAKIDVTIPGTELAVSHIENEDVYVAIRDSFNAIEKQISSFIDKQRS